MIKILSFYKIKKTNKLNILKKILLDEIIKNEIKGLLIISKEGINGTLAGKPSNISKISKFIRSTFKFEKFDIENSTSAKFIPFLKAKVKIKKEVVPMEDNFLFKNKTIKKYLTPRNWDNFISKDNVKIIDARKPFEYEIGTFKGAKNPNTNNFREFKNYLSSLNKNEKIGMFCTGGIRCEKASVYLEKKGFKNIYQLNGGILNYLKKTNKKKSLWRGECFVFDNRVSLKHGLKIGTYGICSGCRKPLSTKEKKSEKYEEGVSCPKCHSTLTKDQKLRFRMRQKQINLAKKEGKRHTFQKEY